MSNKKESIKADGEVIKCLGCENFRVELENGAIILANPSGKMRMRHIRIMTGDRVEVEFSPYDLARGRIVYRYKTSN